MSTPRRSPRLAAKAISSTAPAVGGAGAESTICPIKASHPARVSRLTKDNDWSLPTYEDISYLFDDSEDDDVPLPPITITSVKTGVKTSDYFDYVSKIYNKMKVDGWTEFKIGSIDRKASAFVEGRWQFVEDGKAREPTYSDALAYASFLILSAKILTK